MTSTYCPYECSIKKSNDILIQEEGQLSLWLIINYTKYIQHEFLYILDD